MLLPRPAATSVALVPRNQPQFVRRAGCMPIYSFSLINHLGERFGTRQAACPDDHAAIEHAKPFEEAGYPVEVHIGGRRVSLSSTPPWAPEDWLAKVL